MYWIKSRDKYGRQNWILKDGSVTVGVLVKLPRQYMIEYGDAFLFNWWAGPRIQGRTIVQYFKPQNIEKIKEYVEVNV